MKPKTTVGVIFGSRSGEHEVAVISAHQVMAALEVAGFDVLPIYVTKQGGWYAGPPLNNIKIYSTPNFDPGNIEGVYRVSMSPDPTVRQLLLHPDSKLGLFKKPPHLWADVFFPVFHGSFGEDGSIQGLFELADVAYTGPGLLSAAVTMDKSRTKALCRDAGIPVLDWITFGREEWREIESEKIAAIESFEKYPLIVKPVSLGSSIGVRKCKSRDELKDAIETALVLDTRVIIERALEDFYEINCSVMGPKATPSVCEQPVPRSDVLTFEDKYKRGGKTGGKAGSKLGAQSGSKGGASQSSGSGMASLDRIIPAPISSELTKEIQALAVRAFDAVACSGICRLDFLVERQGDKVYFNEMNPIPGSLAFYLWEATGVPFDKLVSRSIEIAFEQASIRRETKYSFDANLLVGNG